MSDFEGLLARDFGLKPQGKSAPMAPPRDSTVGGFSTFPTSPIFWPGSSATDLSGSLSSTRKKSDSMPLFDGHDRPDDDLLFKDVFGGSQKYGSSDSRARPQPSVPAFDYDSVFKDQNAYKSASMPAFDKPVYDEGIFQGISGLKSSTGSASARFENVFASLSSSPPKDEKQDSFPFDDLLGNLVRKDKEPNKTERARQEKKDTSVFDDLIPGFGLSSSPTTNRSAVETSHTQEESFETKKKSENMMADPFVVLESASTSQVSSSGLFMDPLEGVSEFRSSGSRKADHSYAHGAFDDKRGQGRIHVRTGSMNGVQSPVESSESHSPKNALFDDFSSSTEANSPVNKTSRSDESFELSDDVWLTISEIPLFTQPTSAPPPSRPPPPRPARPLKKNVNGPSSFSSSTQYCSGPRSARASARSSVASQIDELEDFATHRTRSSATGYPEAASSAVDSDANSVAAASAAAMKEAMDKAEAKFRYARETREKEYIKEAKSKEGIQAENDDSQERELREKQERLEHDRLVREKERERAREMEMERESEREQRRLERERTERERELARQAVERATREARERAAAEARARAQRAAVEKAAGEARERAERAAVQRAQAEARERAAAVARERAEKAAAERAAAERAAAERANAEVREREAKARAQRATVDRAAAEARERAAAQARANQQRNENDLESFFGMGSRPSSAPRQRTNSSDPVVDTQNKGGSFDAARTSSWQAPNIRQASSTTNIVDDLSSIFGAASQSGEFQEVEGESEERRRARLERQQRTQERTAKALAEKNERDLQAQKEQEERHRIAETLDVEIKRWAAGKEGSLRALLSTLQYVLWPECGWQPVSLTDLITAASVKKVYRKATLCIHPDKVQQKGANLRQKYVAEKVFDLLKEAWNKFNSEELF